MSRTVRNLYPAAAVLGALLLAAPPAATAHLEGEVVEGSAVTEIRSRLPAVVGEGPGAASPADPAPTLALYRLGERRVRQALDAMGGLEALTAAGGITLTGRGTQDLTTMMQGTHPERPDLVPLTEKLAVDLDSGRVAFESRARVNPDADEWLRVVYDDAGRLLIVLRLAEEAFWVPADEDQKRRYFRIVPHLLLRDALDRRTTLRHLGQFGSLEAVAFTLDRGEQITLLLDPEDCLLRGFEYLLDLPLVGDTAIRWELDDYVQVEGLGRYPAGYRIFRGDRLLKEVVYEEIRPGVEDAAVLREPEGIVFPEPPEPEPPTAAGPAPEPADQPSLAEVRTLADGVYLAMSVRPGFHVLFVELEDWVVVVDAPAGYHDLHMVPAVDWAGDVTSSSVGRRLLDTIRATVPDKPVGHVVLTHHHGDHAGGIRPFLAAGATVLASSATGAVVERAAGAPFTLEPDELSGRDPAPRIEVVDGRRTLSDGKRTVEILNVGPNPHAEGMLVVYLPESRILYQSDLFMPTESGFPDPARVPVMKWFVRWLDASGLDPERIYAIHGSAQVTVEQLEVIRSLAP